MARFKVGDYVTIARLGKNSPPSDWGHMIGKTLEVLFVEHTDTDNPSYYVDYPTHYYWKENELEPSKEHKVLEILRNYEKSRNNMG